MCSLPSSFRKSSISIGRHLLAANQWVARPLSSNLQGSSSSFSSPVGSDVNKTKSFNSKASTMVISGSLLGIYLYYNSYDVNSTVAFADDSSKAKALDSELEDTKSKPSSKYLFRDSYRRRVFFNYEKRLRMQSPPEKVFEYFASVKINKGEFLMTPADLMRAVVPVFPPSESSRVREGFLKGEKPHGELCCEPSKFFMLFDTNNDGLISFAEYIFFVTLLSIPESSFSVAFKMFDLDNNGHIDRDEFKKVMALMRSQNRQGAQHRDGRRLGLKGDAVENGGLLEFFFGKDGETNLQHSKFVQFLRDLQEEACDLAFDALSWPELIHTRIEKEAFTKILELEFRHYDYRKCGTISTKDFCLSMVASVDISHINKFLDRVDELDTMPSLRDVRITFEEFRNFAELRKQLESLALGILSHSQVNGMITKKDLQRATSQVCGVDLTDNVVDVIFHVFDSNRDGSLSSNEFVRVLQRREGENSRPREPGFPGLISCMMNCTKKNPSGSALFQ